MIHLTKIIAGILVLLALAVGGYAWVLGRQPAVPAASVARGAAPASDTSRMYPVVVTSKAVPAGQVVPPDALRLAQLPLKPGGSFTEIAPLAGRVAAVDLPEGTPLQEGQLVSGLALRLADGERAVAIKADEVLGVGGRVQPGDFVDVFVLLKGDGKEVDRSQSRLLLARQRVLAFGSNSVDGGPSKKDDGKNGSAQARTELARTAVLAVPVADVNRLALGEATGRLLLALRNPADLAQPDPRLFAEPPTALQTVAARPGEPRKPLEGIDKAQAGLAVADLANTGAAPTPRRDGAIARSVPVTARTGPAPSPSRGGLDVEIIRGDKREIVSY